MKAEFKEKIILSLKKFMIGKIIGGAKAALAPLAPTALSLDITLIRLFGCHKDLKCYKYSSATA